MSGVMSKASTNKKFNMDNPKDREFILQYMLADVSKEELSDSCSIGSEDEFSGEDVGDDSDLEHSEDDHDIELNFEAGRELMSLNANEIVDNVNNSSLSASPQPLEKTISGGNRSNQFENDSFELNHIETTGPYTGEGVC